MRAVIQIVKCAEVTADGERCGKIGKGLYILLGVKRGDSDEDARILAKKIANLRIFSDECGKMNLSVKDVGGDVLVVSNFTLISDYSHGNRPSYFDAASPGEADRLYNLFIDLMSENVGRQCMSGKFGSDMVTDMVTTGPVTIVIDSDFLKTAKHSDSNHA